MTTFNFKGNFQSLTINAVLTNLLNDIPATVSSYNFLIVGDSLIIPLGDSPKESYSVQVAKKDQGTNNDSLSISQAQDGSTIISQRIGEQIRVTAAVSLDFFNKLFNFGTDFIQVSAVGVVDFLFQFAYDNFLNTDCILVDETGIRGAGTKRLRISDWNRAFDPNDADKLNLDIQLYFQEPTPPEQPPTYQIDQQAVNAALL